MEFGLEARAELLGRRVVGDLICACGAARVVKNPSIPVMRASRVDSAIARARSRP